MASLVSNFIGGESVESSSTAAATVRNPSTGEAIAQTPLSNAADVDQAVRAALDAFRSWSQTTAARRTEVLFRYKELLEAHFEELARLVVRENGKTFPEAQGDVRRGIEVVEFACGRNHLLKGESLPQLAEGMDGVTSLEPLGVCAGITPFNFPAMVPMWMFPIAIACGNTFILKPSEKVPLTAIRLAELFAEAGLPGGVLNLVHGGREVVDALCSHADIAAVSFVGSTPVARHVHTLATANGKRVQAAGGAKNVLLVMPDAEPDSTLRAVMGAAYGCAGQRCMAGSVVMGVGDAADGVRDGIANAIDGMRLLPTHEHDDSDMGPVIDASARDRLVAAIGSAAEEGAAVVRDGRENLAGLGGYFVGPTLLDRVSMDMKISHSELFGPVLSLSRPDSLAEAIEWINSTGYGNGAVIFTGSGAAARQFSRGVQCGMVGVNVGIPAPMSIFAFSGWNDSFYGDLHVQGMEGIRFYTRQKVVFSRWDDAYARHQGW